MATILVIDSATEACSVALFADGVLVDGRYEVLGRGHAERLVPMIAELPGRGRVDRIAVSLGPGSFTGVRVGLAAARALALAWNARLVGFPTLALVAAMAREQAAGEDLAVAMTGGHGEWFVERRGYSLASMRPADAAAAVTEAVVAGSQAEALVALRGHGRAIALLPDARAFAALDPANLSVDTQPLYGRPPDARLPGEAAR